MVRILHIVPALCGGGVENLLLNYYKNMNKNKFKFDFIVHGDNIGELEATFENLGCKIFHIPTKRSSFIKNVKAMKDIIYTGNYDVVHVHQDCIAAIPIYCAKMANVKMRIAHSHIAYENKSILKRCIEKICIPILKKYSTHWVACGEDAARFLWGDIAFEDNKVDIIKNAIDIEKFSFDNKKRQEKRKELGIEDRFVVGCVARLSYQKNHEFLIEIFNEIYKNEKKAILLVVGTGELEDEIRLQVNKLGLSKVVRFLGVRKDVNEILQSIDAFVLPSRYEGLGIAYIEAQAAGLPCFASDGVVPLEAKVTDLMEFIDLDESPKNWARKILKYKNNDRVDKSKDLIISGYDIRKECIKLERYYETSK